MLKILEFIKKVENSCEKMQLRDGNSILDKGAVIQINEWHLFTVVPLCRRKFGDLAPLCFMLFMVVIIGNVVSTCLCLLHQMTSTLLSLPKISVESFFG